jgi:outer membrane protein assembly factor BamB
MVALRKSDGKTAWKKDRTINYQTDDGYLKKAYGTASIITVKGKPQLISTAAVGTIAYDPQTGKELWKVHHGGMNSAAPPLFGHGKVFLTTGYGRVKVLAVRPDGSGDVGATHVDWTLGKGPVRPSPILVGDLLYMIDEGGIATCVEAKTGTLVWTKRVGDKHTTSPIYAAGHLYFFTEDGGKGFVVSTGRSARIVAVNQLDDGCMATPAVAGKALFVRTKTHLYRIEEK